MSLVHQALRKAEQEKLRKQGAASPPAPVRLGGAGVGPATPTVTPAPAMVAAAHAAPHVVPAPTAPAHAPAAVHRRRGPWVLAVIFAAFLLVIVVGFIGFWFLQSTPAGSAAPAGVAPAFLPAASPASGPTGPAAPPAAPPGPAAGAAASTGGFALTGIMRDAQGRECAVLNGRVVYPGYAVDGAIIKSIERDRLTLEVNGQEKVLRLY